jgi:hypothetical protein
MKNLILGSLVLATLIFTGCGDDDDDTNTTQPTTQVFSVDAGANVNATVGEAVVIDATVSNAEGNLTYEWKEGNTSLITGVEDINYSADSEGVHTLTISVTNDKNETVSDSVDVNVTTGDNGTGGGNAGTTINEYSTVKEAASGVAPTCDAGYSLPTFAQIDANIDAIKALNNVNAEGSLAALPDSDGKDSYYIPNGNHWKRVGQKINYVCVK